MQPVPDGPASPQSSDAGFSVAIFLSALLLFSVQPLEARALLPRFGGSAGLWNSCQVFFLSSLVLGYGYAHLSLTRLTPHRQFYAHCVLLAVSWVFLPIYPGDRWNSLSGNDPTLSAILTLCSSVGGPYFVLAATSPLVSTWYQRVFPGQSPYRLFAWSNLGSLIGLLGYPFVIEPNMGIHVQTYVWSVLFVLWSILMIGLGHRARSGDRPHAISDCPPPPAASVFLWLLLPFWSTVLLIAVTQHIATSVASVPLIWVIPLALYLLSYVAVTSEGRWQFYQRKFAVPLFFLALYVIQLLLVPSPILPTLLLVLLWCCVFVMFFVLHGELWRHKPAAPLLSSFYLTLSAGGALGSLFVAVACPALFQSQAELPLTLFLAPLLLALSCATDPQLRLKLPFAGMMLALFLVFLYINGYGLLSAHYQNFTSVLAARRNFYGWARVIQRGNIRIIIDGLIDHGFQDRTPGNQSRPVSYFGPNSGIGRLFGWKRVPGKPLNVAVVGLGAGTLATYGRPGDRFLMVEIDPKVVELSKRYFTFLSDCQANLEVVVADGRICLDSQRPGSFDIVVLDAFSGDSVPLHLITREAVEAYWRCLSEGGILAFNLSNPYLDLAPVLARHAQGLGCLLYTSPSPRD